MLEHMLALASRTRAFVPASQHSRRNRRGMLLIVVLVLLVALAMIGVAFGSVVFAEEKAAQNAQDRFRALSAARDGEALTIARLRMRSTQAHYEGEGNNTFNRIFTSDGKPDRKSTRLNSSH